MRMNAVSCLVFGILFTFQPSRITHFLGDVSMAPPALIVITGIILILNGCHLLWASKIALPKKELILYFSGGDFIWVIASISLIISELWITSLPGIITTIAVAIMVGSFGLLQMIKRKEMGHC